MASTNSLVEAFRSASDAKDKAAKGCAAIKSITADRDAVKATEILTEVLHENFPLVSSRPIVLCLSEELCNAPSEFQKEVGSFALERLKSRSASFEDAIPPFCELLASVYEQEEEWRKAAEVLGDIPLSSGIRALSDEYKMKTNVRIAQLYLEDDDPVQAESFIQRATSLLQTVQDEEIKLLYKFCYVRILDAKRKFLDAAAQYYDLSVGEKLGDLASKVDPEELMESLSNACTCAILVRLLCPKRSRILAALYKDERSSKLQQFPVLEKMFLERMLKKEEVAIFQQSLKPHQLAQLGDGSTVLDKAVMEHNIRSAGLIYRTVMFEPLADLLGVSKEKVARSAAQMIVENRLSGTIDEAAGVLSYESEATSKIATWNRLLENSCLAVNTISDIITTTS